jgi:hypothetical protein
MNGYDVPIMADYEAPRSAFEQLFQPECGHPILLLRGTSGSGKTTLLAHCCAQIPSAIIHVPIQLRGSAVSVSEIFSRAGKILSWARLPQFTDRIANLEGVPSVKIDRNWISGINNRIIAVLHAEKEGDREQRRATLTEAWFDDLAALEQPILMLFDTFEHASGEVQDWLSGPFLARVVRTFRVRVIVAGQFVPDMNNIEWGVQAKLHDLYGVLDACHWMPVIEKMRRRIPFASPEVWFAGVCHALKGKPDAIMKVIQGLPEASSL